MSDFPECEHLRGRVRELCRGEAGTVAACNHMRAGWGFEPLPDGHEIRRPATKTVLAIPVSTPICCERGRTLELMDGSASCGCDRRVFACPHKGRCVQLDPAKVSAKTLIAEAREKGLQICAECELFESMSESGPS